jgi:hypothetical protein
VFLLVEQRAFHSDLAGLSVMHAMRLVPTPPSSIRAHCRLAQDQETHQGRQDIALPQGEQALSSPDKGDHDNGSGKSNATHHGHKSLAFNL